MASVTGAVSLFGNAFAMEARHSFASKILLILAFVCAISIGTVVQNNPSPGRLTVESDYLDNHLVAALVARSRLK